MMVPPEASRNANADTVREPDQHRGAQEDERRQLPERTRADVPSLLAKYPSISPAVAKASTPGKISPAWLNIVPATEPVVRSRDAGRKVEPILSAFCVGCLSRARRRRVTRKQAGALGFYVTAQAKSDARVASMDCRSAVA